MVKEKEINNKKYYQCNICKFYYKTKEQVEKCQAWCNKHHSCNIKITKFSVNPEKEKSRGCC